MKSLVVFTHIEELVIIDNWMMTNADINNIHKSIMIELVYTIQQESSETSYVRQREYGLDPESVFQNLTGTSLSKDTSVIKFSWKSDNFLWRYKPNCGKNALSRSVEESFKKFLDPVLEADDFQNLISSFHVHRYIW